MKKVIPLIILVCLLFGVVIINSCKKDPVIPTLTTNAITNVAVNSVTSGGLITKDGGEAVTARGVCWGTSTNPSLSGSYTSNGTGTGSFESNITDLTANTLYYVRAYATNSVGTAYGNEISFTTNPILVPTVTTTTVSAVTLSTAVSGGNITADGGGAITAKGVCWATTTSPAITNSKTSDGTGVGIFSSTLSGLLPGTTYYLRAYATNSAGTAYGNEISFITSQLSVATLTTAIASSITLTTAVSGGNITSDGGGAITAKGVCWATTTGPTITSSKTSDGTGVGTFVSNLSGLLPGTTYYLRAYATNSVGTAYGNEVSFATNPISLATLTTTAVTPIGLTTAVSGGIITADGGGTITARGICWSTSSGPTINDSKTINGTGTGSFISNLSILVPATTYYVRAYATNSGGTAYGNEVSFTTLAISVATLTTNTVTAIGLTTAVSGGSITSDGGGTITAKGVCWATTTGPTLTDSKTTDAAGTDSFSSDLTGLLPGTIYYVRAYATNSAGTGYGNEVSFTTSLIVPASLTTAAVTSVGTTTAVSGGNITSAGGGTVTARGVCWATTTTPTTSNYITLDATGTGTFISNLTGLLPGTTYYVRAYATNGAGTAYGNEVSFTSLVAVATLTTTSATSITPTTAASGGNITAAGGGTITERGTCWATTANPTIANSRTTDGSGTGSFVSNLTALLPATTYHIRSYATNSAGTGYGNDLTFTTSPVQVPVLTTTTVTGITVSTATSGGNITANGGGAITGRGVCWAVTPNPTTTSSKTTDGTGTGSFTSNLTYLQSGTTYYVRAYATNSAGTGYGNELSFTTTATIPTLTTTAVSAITLNSATSGGNITTGGAVTARGVCWGTSTTPTILNSFTTNGTGIGSFTSNLSGLQPGTTYFVRAYATNSAGTGYGNEFSFNTNVADADGNTYSTVKIGTQLWFGENLKTTSYSNNGTSVLIGTTPSPNTDISAELTPKYQWAYDGNIANVNIYGRLYTWFAVTDSRNICPTGWHVPTDAQLEELKTFLGGESLAGGKLKETGTTHWQSPNTAATNEVGFTALPGGYRSPVGDFVSIGFSCYFWSSTQNEYTPSFGWGQGILNTSGTQLKGGYPKTDGVHVRCLKD